MSKSSYKDVFFGATSKKELDKAKEVVDNKDTEKTEVKSTVFEPNYQAYSIVKTGTREYKLLVVDVDLNTMESKAQIVDIGADNEVKAISDMNKRLAVQSRGFRK